MPKVAYIEKKFQRDSLQTIENCNRIVEDYQRQGYRLTLRQLYYRLVAANLIPNDPTSYKRLGGLVGDARKAGLIDWNAIEDRARNLRGESHWDNPGHIIRSAYYGYHIDYWMGQKYRLEVWVEKDALVGIVGTVCSRLDVPYLACRGYNSLTEEWDAVQRLNRWRKLGYTPIILYLGDHDPSGLDMTRDHEDRIHMFGGRFEIIRLALNMDQVEVYNPPPNPAKQTDSRFEEYAQTYGHSCWELDALEPNVIDDIISENILSYREEAVYQEIVAQEAKEKELLRKAADNWESVADFLGGLSE